MIGRAFVGRQAIMDRRNTVWAYQLLYRDADPEGADLTNPHSASATVILNAFVEIGLEHVVGSNRLLLEVPPEAVLDDYSSLLPSDRVILQIAAFDKPELHFMAGLKYLRARKFLIGIEGLDPKEQSHPLLEAADVVRFDLDSADPDDFRDAVSRLRRLGIRTIAGKVETPQQYENASKIGFEYFQGHYLDTPRVFQRTKPASSDLRKMLELLRLLNDPNAKLDDVERLVVTDVTLSYRLLRCLNSGAFSFPQRIANVRQAIVLLGFDNLRKWTTVLAVAKQTQKPIELLRIALIRGLMCESLAKSKRQADPRTFFTVGFFSVLDALLDQPIEEAMRELPFVPEVNAAVLRHEGQAGRILESVIAYERGEWGNVSLDGIDDAAAAAAWLHAAHDADELTRELA